MSFGVAAAKALEEGKLDGFWANGMGAEVAVRNGTGTLVLDARRGDGPAAARDYTFPALVTTQRRIDEEPDTVAAAVRALVRAQQALKEEPGRATEVGRKLFPGGRGGADRRADTARCAVLRSGDLEAVGRCAERVLAQHGAAVRGGGVRAGGRDAVSASLGP